MTPLKRTTSTLQRRYCRFSGWRLESRLRRPSGGTMAEPEHPAERISSEEVAREAARLDGAPAEEILAWADARFGERAATAKLLREKGAFSFRKGLAERHECCGIRKLEPLQRALKGRAAWVTGLRREQSSTRSAIRAVEVDAAHGGIAKVNPLAAWTEAQTWAYVAERGLPYNPLHDRGFRSIGCAPCTRAIRPYEDVRAGRWWWEQPDHKECGLHGRGTG